MRQTLTSPAGDGSIRKSNHIPHPPHFEIDSEEDIPLEVSHYSNSWEHQPSKNSIELANMKITPGGSLIGFGLMLIAIIALSIMHIMVKASYVRNPKLSNFDSLSFIGWYLAPFYFLLSKYSGVSLNIFKLERRQSVLIITRVLAGNFLNVFLFGGMQYISVGKSTLIYNLNPICCMILATFILSEKMSRTNVACTIAAFSGIYLLTLNQPKSDSQNGNPLIGYTMVFMSAWCFGTVFICLRLLSIRGVHYFVGPFYIGVSAVLTTVFVLIFFPDKMHIMEYDFIDFCMLSCNGLCGIVSQICLTYAYKYELASKLSPMAYLENVLTLLADIFIFHYAFATTDVIGILVIVVCLAIPIISKVKQMSS